MLRVAANGVGRTGFHHAAEVHDDDHVSSCRSEHTKTGYLKCCPDQELNLDYWLLPKGGVVCGLWRVRGEAG